MICSKCGNHSRKIFNGMCQACYNYYRKGGTDNALPDIGRIAYDYRGCVICHICGRAYKRLGSHIRETHHMTISAYKEQFGLCNNARTTEKAYSQRMHDSAYENGMSERLRETGKKTRVKKGETKLRKGKKVRLQECLDRSDRYKKSEV